MEYLIAQEREGRQKAQASSKSMRVRQTEKFIPPTHPAYVVTSSFEAPHISSLQEEFDKHFIAMGMQTGKKKLVKMAGMPTDKFFIIVDDSGIPIVLEGEFLTLTSKVVRYPRANSAEEVVKAFEKYIGFGHYEISKEYEQVNNHSSMQGQQHALRIERGMIEMPQQSLQQAVRVDQSAALASLVSSSGIRLREVSSIHKESTLFEGLIFIYDNRKDSSEFKGLVSKLKRSYQGSSRVRFINRIDEYISFIRIGKRYDNVILMSEYSYLHLAQYFQKFKGFAVFQQKNTQMNLFTAKNVLFFAQDELAIEKYLRKALEGSGITQIKSLKANQQQPLYKLKQSPAFLEDNVQNEGKAEQTYPHYIINQPLQPVQKYINASGHKPEQKMRSNALLLNQVPIQNLRVGLDGEGINEKSRIKLIKVSDLSKEQINRLKNNAQSPSPKDITQPVQAALQTNEPVKPIMHGIQAQKAHKNGNLPANIYYDSIRPQVPKSNDVSAKRVPFRQVTVTECQPKLGQMIKQAGDYERIEYDAPLKLPSIDKGMPMERSEKSISSISAKSKIKRLKSVKSVKQTKNNTNHILPKDLPQKAIEYKVSPALVKQERKKSLQKPPISSILKGHLRMGSDENYCRSQQKPKMSHYRALSADKDKDHEQTPYIKFCLSSPKPSEESEGEEAIIPVAKVEANYPNQQQPEQRVAVRLRAPVNAAKAAQASSKRLGIDEVDKKSETMAFFPEIDGAVVNSLLPIQNSFGNSGNNQYRIGMPVLSEKEIEDEQERVFVSVPKQPAPLKLAAEMLRTKEQGIQEEDARTFMAIIPGLTNKNDQSQMDPIDKKKLNQRIKVKAAQQNYRLSASPDHTNKQRKLLKSPPIPPTFQSVQPDKQSNSEVEQYSPRIPKIDLVAPSEYSRLKQQTEGAFDICGSSEISSIPRKQTHKAAESKENKRFTFGIGNELTNKLGSKRSPQKLKLQNNLRNTIAFEKMGSQASLQAQNKQNNNPFVPSDDKRDLSGRIAHNAPRKSKSQSQVQRIFDRFKVKAAVETIKQPQFSNLMESEPTQSKANGFGSNLPSQNSNSRVGKIYSQLRCRPSTYRLPRDRSSKPKSMDEYPASGLKNKAVSPQISNKYNIPVVGRSIEDMIDMNRYEKIIENGITVYRSKVPVRVESYYPLAINPSYGISRENPYTNSQNISYPSKQVGRPFIPVTANTPVKKQDPYLLDRKSPKPRDQLLRNKENALSQAKPAARVLARFVPRQPEHKKPEQQGITKHISPHRPMQNDSIGIQCSADPFNSLTNFNNQQLLASISNLARSPRQPNTSKISSKIPPKKPVKSPHPIQDLLASKLSDSERETNPPLIRNLILPKFLTEEQCQDRQDLKELKEEEPSQLQNGQGEKLVLYLVDRLHPKDIASQLISCKSLKDSVLSFKNEQQLLLQLSQTKHIFDIVYVISTSPFDFNKILGKQKNCYLVEFEEGCKTKIKGNLIKVASLKYLTDVTDLILKQSSNNKAKGKQPRKPAKSQIYSCQQHKCLSPRQSPHGRCCEYSVSYCPSLCPAHHRHC